MNINKNVEYLEKEKKENNKKVPVILKTDFCNRNRELLQLMYNYGGLNGLILKKHIKTLLPNYKGLEHALKQGLEYGIFKTVKVPSSNCKMYYLNSFAWCYLKNKKGLTVKAVNENSIKKSIVKLEYFINCLQDIDISNSTLFKRHLETFKKGSVDTVEKVLANSNIYLIKANREDETYTYAKLFINQDSSICLKDLKRLFEYTYKTTLETYRDNEPLERKIKIIINFVFSTQKDAYIVKKCFNKNKQLIRNELSKKHIYIGLFKVNCLYLNLETLDRHIK